MALYLITPPGGGPVLVRARNGHAAMELSGLDEGACERITEDGEPGVIAGMAALEPDSGEAEEVDISTLDDARRGERVLLDRRTRRARTVLKD